MPRRTPDAGIDIENGVYPFIDKDFIQSLVGITHELYPPVPQNVALTLDQPWEGPQSGYGMVMQTPDGKFRMYYRGGGDVTTREVTCIVFSDDGVNWTRPELNLVPIEGQKTTNVVWTAKRKSYGESHNFAPFVDANPLCPTDSLYKAVGLMIYEDETGERRKMLGVFASPDGLHWRALKDKPVIRKGSFDSLNTAFWDLNIGEYVCYSRCAYKGMRSIEYCRSDDFIKWTEPETLEFVPEQDEQYYTNGVTLYPRSPGLRLAFPMRFVPERKEVGYPPRQTDGVSDAVFLTSRDGWQWDRTFREAFIRPGINPANWGNAHGNNTPLTGLLRTGEKELSIFWFENYEATPRIRRGTIRLDGFASLHAGADEGIVLLKQMNIAGGKLYINYSTSAVGYVKVECEISNAPQIRGYYRNDCDEIYGDEIKRLVTWGDKTTLPEHGIIRLRFYLKDADLYAFEVDGLKQTAKSLHSISQQKKEKN